VADDTLPQPSRPSQEIARELAQATKRELAYEPAKELDRALEQQVPQPAKPHWF